MYVGSSFEVCVQQPS